MADTDLAWEPATGGGTDEPGERNLPAYVRRKKKVATSENIVLMFSTVIIILDGDCSE